MKRQRKIAIKDYGGNTHDFSMSNLLCICRLVEGVRDKWTKFTSIVKKVTVLFICGCLYKLQQTTNLQASTRSSTLYYLTNQQTRSWAKIRMFSRYYREHYKRGTWLILSVPIVRHKEIQLASSTGTYMQCGKRLGHTCTLKVAQSTQHSVIINNLHHQFVCSIRGSIPCSSSQHSTSQHSPLHTKQQ